MMPMALVFNPSLDEHHGSIVQGDVTTALSIVKFFMNNEIFSLPDQGGISL